MKARVVARVAVPLAVAAFGLMGMGGESQKPAPLNPHGGDFIFRVTGTVACSDCHATAGQGNAGLRILDNAAVQALKAKAKGVHGPGRFADCFRCHAGGHIDREIYQKPKGK